MAILSFKHKWLSVIAHFALCNFFYTIILHRLVENFEKIATNLVQLKNFTRIEVYKNQIVFIAEKVNGNLMQILWYFNLAFRFH